MTRARRMAAPAALATTVILWASAFAAIREAVRTLGWAHLSFLRLAAAALVLGALAAVRRVGRSRWFAHDRKWLSVARAVRT